MYTPPRAWPFYTWAVLAVMWHLAPEGTPTGTAEEIAWDLHAWPANQDFPWRRPQGGLPVAPAAEGFSLAATLQRQPDRRACHFLQTGTAPAAPPDSGWQWDAREAQPLPDLWILPLWYLPTDALAHTTQAVKGTFPPPPIPRGGPPPQPTGEGGQRTVARRGRTPEPVLPPGAGSGAASPQGHEDRGMVGDRARHGWITAAAPQPMLSPRACHRLLRAVPPLDTRHALTRDVWRAMLSHLREGMATLGAQYPPGPVLEQLTVPTPGVRHVLHRAFAPTEQLTGVVLDLALKPLQVLYPQAHIPPAGTSNHVACLGLQRRIEAAHAGGVVEQGLALHNLLTTQGHWYLHQLLFLPRAAPEHRRQKPYHTHPERLGAQGFPQLAPPALPPGQGPEALLQGPSLDTSTTVQQRGASNLDGAEPEQELRVIGLNCGLQAPRPGHHGT